MGVMHKIHTWNWSSYSRMLLRARFMTTKVLTEAFEGVSRELRVLMIV